MKRYRWTNSLSPPNVNNYTHLHAPKTLDLKGSAWQISAHSCTACVRSISAKEDQKGSENAPWNRQGVLRTRIRVVRLHSQPQRGLTSILLNKAFSLGGRVVGMLVNYSRTGLYHRKVRLARRPRGTNENGDCICDYWSATHSALGHWWTRLSNQALTIFLHLKNFVQWDEFLYFFIYLVPNAFPCCNFLSCERFPWLEFCNVFGRFLQITFALDPVFHCQKPRSNSRWRMMRAWFSKKWR